MRMMVRSAGVVALSALVAAGALGAGFAREAASTGDALAVREGSGWTTWWRRDAAPPVWDGDALAARVVWRAASPGMEWGELLLRGSSEAWRTRVVVVRLDPRQVDLTLAAAFTEDRRWSAADADTGSVLALDAGQFRGDLPWGWVLTGGRELLRPQYAPLAGAVVVDRSGDVRIVSPDSVEAERARGSAREAFQSYPMLLQDGMVPTPLREEGLGVSLEHRDARLALGTLADGRVIVALTRFDALGEGLGRVPFGLTSPEMASGDGRPRRPAGDPAGRRPVRAAHASGDRRRAAALGRYQECAARVGGSRPDRTLDGPSPCRFPRRAPRCRPRAWQERYHRRTFPLAPGLEARAVMSSVTPEQLATLSRLLEQVLDLAPAERAAWLAELSVANPAAATEIGGLLAREPELDTLGFLGDRLWADRVAPATLAGRQLGAYTLERPLGQGGMGTVWLARRSDGRFEGQVAVKLLNLALLDPVGGERFRREGTLLARLSHPHIARLLDAGVADDGQPYLVLEYVEGLPIDRFCEERRLGMPERLSLFRDVLSAVAHAHANLIVHRDIKPSNILVSDDGSVKLLDFGIAKLIDPEGVGERSALTMAGGSALTPEFAAPEQVQGEPITTATDVYALGVLLYLLLARRHPTAWAAHSPAEAIRSLLDVEPARLGLGDLDTVLAKSLRKGAAERYQTVAAFNEDLGRYEREEPVTARPDSLAYRARKFFGRHRAAVLAGAAVAAALVLATAFSVGQMQEARRQRDAAVLQRKRAGAQIEFQDLLMSQVGDQPLTIRQILDRSRAGLERQYAGDSTLLGVLLLQLADRYVNLGDLPAQDALLSRSESLATALGNRALMAETRCHRVDYFRTQGQYAEARAELTAADSILSTGPRDPVVEVACLLSRSRLGFETDRGAESETASLRALAIKDSLGEHGDQVYLETLHGLASARDANHHYRNALELFARAERVADSTGRGGTITSSMIQHDRALTLVALGATAEAEPILHHALAQAERSDGSGWIHWQPLIHYAETAYAQQHMDSAAKYFGFLTAQAVRDSNPYWEGRGLFGLARAQMNLGRWSDARRSADRYRGLIAEYPRINNTDDHVPDSRVLDGMLALGRGDTAAAHAAFMESLRANKYFEGRWRMRLRLPVLLAAETGLALGDRKGALELARQAVTTAAVDSLALTTSLWVGEARLVEGRALLASGDTAAARGALEQAVTALSTGGGETHPETDQARREVAAIAPASRRP